MTSKKALLLLALTALSTASCGGGGSSLSGIAGEGVESNPKAKVAVGESCQSGDPDHICLALDYVVYKHADGSSVTPGQAAAVIHQMNQIHVQCNLGFQIETFAAVDPADHGLVNGAGALGQLDQIRETFQSNNKLLVATTGPWGMPQIAWTTLPGGTGVYGAIISGASQTDAEVIAHELGHYLGLDHLSDQSNLMNPVVYSTRLSETQCQQMRATVQDYWRAMRR